MKLDKKTQLANRKRTKYMNRYFHWWGSSNSHLEILKLTSNESTVNETRKLSFTATRLEVWHSQVARRGGTTGTTTLCMRTASVGQSDSSWWRGKCSHTHTHNQPSPSRADLRAVLHKVPARAHSLSTAVIYSSRTNYMSIKEQMEEQGIFTQWNNTRGSVSWTRMAQGSRKNSEKKLTGKATCKTSSASSLETQYSNGCILTSKYILNELER